ncbi:uncharacterized protein LOC105381523 [Plutella xylostella]|nr:uncharacterized protein LOC105381523 [Plutella xylostella]
MKAKRKTSAAKLTQPAKKPKKKEEEKPTLTVSKVAGEYRVELQVRDEKQKNKYTPLIYKIASANNEEKIKKKERYEQRLIDKVWDKFEDPVHPDVCQTRCLKAYQQAIGQLPAGECICPQSEVVDVDRSDSSDDEDTSSYCSSLDVDWEIHFTPPFDSKITK